MGRNNNGSILGNITGCFFALCLMIKLPNPRRNTSSPFVIDVLIVFIILSTITNSTFVGKPVFDAILLTVSIFVIGFCFIIRKRSEKVINFSYIRSVKRKECGVLCDIVRINSVEIVWKFI